MNDPATNRRAYLTIRGMANELAEGEGGMKEAAEWALKMEAALRLVLLFYAPGAWQQEHRLDWYNAMIQAGSKSPTYAATTRIICDTIRDVLGITPEQEQKHG